MSAQIIPRMTSTQIIIFVTPSEYPKTQPQIMYSLCSWENVLFHSSFMHFGKKNYYNLYLKENMGQNIVLCAGRKENIRCWADINNNCYVILMFEYVLVL